MKIDALLCNRLEEGRENFITKWTQARSWRRTSEFLDLWFSCNVSKKEVGFLLFYYTYAEKRLLKRSRVLVSKVQQEINDTYGGVLESSLKEWRNWRRSEVGTRESHHYL